jgi:hypothetical protein
VTTDRLPAARPAGSVPDVRNGLPGMAADFVQTIQAASDTMRLVSAAGGNDASDVEVVALTGWVCTGDTAADALQAAADLARESPGLEITSLQWAKVALPVSEGDHDGAAVVENWEWKLTVVVVKRDPVTGEPGGSATEGR